MEYEETSRTTRNAARDSSTRSGLFMPRSDPRNFRRLALPTVPITNARPHPACVQRASDQILRDAARRAEDVMADARRRAAAMLEDARERARALIVEAQSVVDASSNPRPPGPRQTPGNERVNRS